MHSYRIPVLGRLVFWMEGKYHSMVLFGGSMWLMVWLVIRASSCS